MSDPLVSDNVIMVRINGKVIETTIDDDGIQRLPCRPLAQYLLNKSALTLNDLGEMVGFGMFPVDDLRWLYQNIGYSVSGYADIWPDDEIENPLGHEEKT